MRYYAETCKGICVYNLVYNFSIQLFPFKSYVFGVHFSNAIQHVKESFPKGTSQIEIVSLHVIFHDIQLIQRCKRFRKGPRWRVPGPGSLVKAPGPGPRVPRVGLGSQVKGPGSWVLDPGSVPGPTFRVCFQYVTIVYPTRHLNS